MNRNVYFFLLALCLVTCRSAEESEIRTHPNIIVILSDDQGWGDFSFTGNTNLSTPHIDKLVSEGALFTNFYVQPVCSPTRAEFLTGRYALRTGVYDTSEGGERIDLDETTIAEIFKRSGYRTAAYGKWHSGTQYPYHPNGRGFDDFYGFTSGHWGSYFDPMLDHNGQITYGNGYLPDDLTTHALEFIAKNNDTPFFLYLPFNTPHDPMQVPDMWYDKFKDKDLALRATDADAEDLAHTRAALAMCENIDWNVGRIMQKLQDLNIENNTIILYFNDNGPNGYRWNGGMKGRKGSTDEGGVRSPLIMRWPGHIKGGTIVNDIAASIDLLPTLAALGGVPVTTSKPLDGISLVPQLTGANTPSRLIVNQWQNKVSVRSDSFRLDHEGALFNMLTDRAQTTDVRNEHPKTYDQLLKAKKHYEEDVVSELPAADNRTYPVGHPQAQFTQLPARDAIPHGQIKRSNQWPNCSFLTNWVSVTDSITWKVEVWTEGEFEAILYYTCKPENTGALLQLEMQDQTIRQRVTEAFDPPLRGMEHDRIPRQNSYVKDFRTMSLGTIKMEKGQGTLVLSAREKTGHALVDVRMLMLKRIK